MKTWKTIERGIYRHTPTGTLYERPSINGRATFRSLGTSKLSEARETLAARRTDQKRAELGLAKSPYARPEAQTVGEVIQRYLDDGCKDRHLRTRRDKCEKAEKRHCSRLLKWWTREPANDVTVQS